MPAPEITITTHHVRTEDGCGIVYDQYSRGSDCAVILVHGFFNSRRAVLFRDMARTLAKDMDVIVMDLRGHGHSSGLFAWTAREHLDVAAVVDGVRGSYEKLGLIGFSLGAAASIIAAGRGLPVDSLLAVSAPSAFWGIDMHFWTMNVEENIIYNIWGEGRIGKGIRPGPLWYRKTRPLDIVGQVRMPVMFLHGKKDWLIRPRHSRRLFQQAREPRKLVIVPGGSHAEYLYRQDRAGTIAVFRDWLQDSL